MLGDVKRLGPARNTLAALRGRLHRSLAMALLAAAACGDGGSLEPAELVASCSDGPRVVFDPLTEYTPEVPLPNENSHDTSLHPHSTARAVPARSPDTICSMLS